MLICFKTTYIHIPISSQSSLYGEKGECRVRCSWDLDKNKDLVQPIINDQLIFKGCIYLNPFSRNMNKFGFFDSLFPSITLVNSLFVFFCNLKLTWKILYINVIQYKLNYCFTILVIEVKVKLCPYKQLAFLISWLW